MVAASHDGVALAKFISKGERSSRLASIGMRLSRSGKASDANIDNIGAVLGANDYDKDGLQEIYFGLTDGSAYLHAYMHADGNIRYANYQNQQQVISFLTANGFGASTYAGWFPPSSPAFGSDVFPDLESRMPMLTSLDDSSPFEMNFASASPSWLAAIMGG